jgi:hypothetical protein
MRVMNNTAVELRGRYIVAVGEKIASSYAFRKIRKGVCFNRAWRYNLRSELALIFGGAIVEPLDPMLTLTVPNRAMKCSHTNLFDQPAMS